MRRPCCALSMRQCWPVGRPLLLTAFCTWWMVPHHTCTVVWHAPWSASISHCTSHLLIPHHSHRHVNRVVFTNSKLPWNDKAKVNKKFNKCVQDAYVDWLVRHMPADDGAPNAKIPPPTRKQYAGWVLEAWEKISDDDLHDVCRQAYFPDGMKFTDLYPKMPKATAAESSSSSNAAPVAAVDESGSSDSQDDSGSDTDGHSVSSMSTVSSGTVSQEEEQPLVVWAKARRGVWGLTHSFNDRLYLIKGFHLYFVKFLVHDP